MNDSSFEERLATGEVLVADGATGTNLQARGLEPGSLAEEWVLDAPGHIVELHRAFVDAGSDIILTCTFSGNRVRLGDSKHADRVAEINRRAAELARQAVGDKAVLVAGSMGPTGRLLEPLGPLTRDDVVSAYEEQARALADGGVDLLVLETFYATDEATAAIEGVKRAAERPLVCSFSYDRGRRTMMGVRPADMAGAVAGLGVTAIGANCSTTPEDMLEIVVELAEQDTGLPIWAKPNAGVPTGTPPVYPVTPDTMGTFARRFVDAGARIVGGCCGSTPEHVRAIASAVR